MVELALSNWISNCPKLASNRLPTGFQPGVLPTPLYPRAVGTPAPGWKPAGSTYASTLAVRARCKGQALIGKPRSGGKGKRPAEKGRGTNDRKATGLRPGRKPRRHDREVRNRLAREDSERPEARIIRDRVRGRASSAPKHHSNRRRAGTRDRGEVRSLASCGGRGGRSMIEAAPRARSAEMPASGHRRAGNRNCRHGNTAGPPGTTGPLRAAAPGLRRYSIFYIGD